MSLLANFSILSSGMGLGFPAITIQSLTNESDPMSLTYDQASWFGKLGFLNLCSLINLLSTPKFSESIE